MLRKNSYNKALRSAFSGRFEFAIDAATLKIALEAGADPDAWVHWQNIVVGGRWKVPALVATTLCHGSLLKDSPVLNTHAADMLLTAGADPHKRWKGRDVGLGWSFSQWVYETGCQEGWDLLKRHCADPALILALPSVKQGCGHDLPTSSPLREVVRAEMSGVVISSQQAVELRNATSKASPPTRVSRL